MSQTRAQSVIETIWNYIVGFILAWVINRYVFHWMGYPVKASETTAITAIFTAVSVVRSYAVRRLFNHFHSHKRDDLILNEEEFLKP